jgi:hypothetical protein
MGRSVTVPVSTSVTTTVDVDTDVDIELDEFIDEVDDDELRAALESRGFGVIATGVGDPHVETIIERAYLVAKRMADLPRELADLFWHVHGRAL